MSLPWNSQSDGSIHVAACAGLRSALSASALYQLVLVGLCCPQFIIRTILYNNVRMHSLIGVINQDYYSTPTQRYRRALAAASTTQTIKCIYMHDASDIPARESNTDLDSED